MQRGLLAGLLVLASAAAPAVAAGGGGGEDLGTKLISPNPGIFVWTLITFIIVLLVLRRFAWGPLLGALEAREKTIRETIEQAQKDREEAAASLKEHRALVEEARRERQAAVETGQREAERLKEEILSEARAQRDQMLQQTQNQVDTAMRQAKAEMRGLVVDLSIQAASKLLAKNVDDSTQRKLVEDYLVDLERSDDGQRPS